VNLAGKFNSIVVKILKLVLGSSHNDVPLKYENNTNSHTTYLSLPFEPSFDLC
jgi:hypothetical protein